ncbi:aminotransferase class I/II-fold pyridoxal phosphate-dependent enzyme [Ancylobacter sonchi]|uniref:aminotransferase class I/II-fold pyridoxal phosphate-dependent enzyme n=1 Tax=Ancylobacter sonchi TaxID=1937790 RepID=UPI001BD4FE8C|nr:aminotransferase class I/II-fold pyridoxal phosphate-dependent enzyme [Ancylobacter sonchi]MBS7534444.1 aminotransferase class I/II-fold pyridoxal phosphate-dependent enzyme [Ancylobacter sonchi]
MTERDTPGRLSQGQVGALIAQMRSVKTAEAPAAVPARTKAKGFSQLAAFQTMAQQKAVSEMLGVKSPYYRVHEAKAGRLTRIDGREVLNFTSYDYIGLNGHPEVSQAATEAIASFGTSVSGSRITSGERPVHAALERSLAALYEAEDAVVFVSGHATAVSAIAALLGPNDLLLHDAWIHNCIVVGGRLSGAARRSFAHNDLGELDAMLAAERGRFDNVMIVTEGLFSMDGDGPDLAALVELKERHGCWLMVDDAHGLGVLGATGRGIAEQCGVDPKRIDIWLGTLSKSLASCGGYVAGSGALVDLLKFAAPGLVYSVGMPTATAAAANAALAVMLREPERLARLKANGHHMIARLAEHGLDHGPAWGYGIVPVIIGDALQTILLAERLLERGIYAFPVLPPGVPNHSARLRFFVSSEHTREDIDHAVAVLAEEKQALAQAGLSIANLTQLLAQRNGAARTR